MKVYILVIILAVAALFGAYSWHKSEVRRSVDAAVDTLNIQYEEQKALLIQDKDRVEKTLREDFNKREGELQNELKGVTAKYNATISWLRKQPKYQPSNSSDTRSTDPAEDSPGEIIGGLSRQDAENLTRYAADTEELKLNLIQCYADYSTVESTLKAFKESNQSR